MSSGCPTRSTTTDPDTVELAVSDSCGFGLTGRPWAAYRLSPRPRRRRHAGLDPTVIARATRLRRYGKFGPLEARKTNRKVGRHVDGQRTRRVRVGRDDRHLPNRRAQSSRLDMSEQPVMRRARPSPLADVIA